MRINNNISALTALNQLTKNENAVTKSLERLSSGKQINRAADDAAGLAISQKMAAQIAGLKKASQNSLDGVSLIQTAEGALSEVHEMLKRMRTLALQVSNGTYTAADRETVGAEVKQLRAEITRISTDIEFNEKKLLNGEIDRRAFPENADFTATYISDTVLPGAYSITVTQDATKAEINAKPANAGATIGETGKITINGESTEIEASDTAEIVFSKLRELTELIGIDLNATNAGGVPTAFTMDGTTSLNMKMQQFGSEFGITINSSNMDLLNKLGLVTDVGGNPIQGVTISGTDVVGTRTTTTTGFNTTATIEGKGNMLIATDINGFEMKIVPKEGMVAAAGGAVTTTVNVLSAGPLILQIGANESQTMEVRVPNMSSKALGLDEINLSTVAGAQYAIGVIDEAINLTSEVRSKLGAYQNRLEYTVSNLDVSAENLTGALSRIEDVDMAMEISTYTQKNVLIQSGTSMLAQANQRPQNVLQLLQQ